MKLLIKSGRIIDPANNIDRKGDILIENGKIKKIGASISSTGINKVIDASNMIVSPGFIDIHVHLREPGREDKETIYTASRSAAKGGITSIVAMPNTQPPADNQTVLEYVLSKAKKDSIVNIFVSGCITKGGKGDQLAEIWEMKESGAVVVTDDGYDIQDLSVYRKAMQYCKTHKMPMLSHTEDSSLAKGGCMHEGKISTQMGLPGIPASAEDTATARIICLTEDVGIPMHFTHVSSSGSVDLIKMAQKKGLNITADCTPHHFSLTDEAMLGYNTFAKVNPPLRDKSHNKAIIKGLKEGTISVIATDHAPHLWTEKTRDVQSAPFGIVGFETMLPLIITNLVDKKVLSMSDAISKITCNPASVLNLQGKGSLSIGSDADIAIFDPNKKQTINRTKFESKGQNSPFHGMKLNGQVTHTIVGGKVVYSV